MSAAPSGFAALSAVPRGSTSSVNVVGDGGTKGSEGVQRPPPPVRARHAAALPSSDPFGNVGHLDEPYTPAAIAASTSPYVAPADSTAASAPHYTDSDAHPHPYSATSLGRAAFSPTSTEEVKPCRMPSMLLGSFGPF